MNSFALIFLQGNAGAFLIQLAPIFAIFGVFYFLVIMPQKRRQRDLQAIIENLKAGDRIITNGGIVATVTAVRDTTLLIRSADKSMLEISRAAVAGLHGELEKN